MATDLLPDQFHASILRAALLILVRSRQEREGKDLGPEPCDGVLVDDGREFARLSVYGRGAFGCDASRGRSNTPGPGRAAKVLAEWLMPWPGHPLEPARTGQGKYR